MTKQQDGLPSPPRKAKLSTTELRARQEERLAAIRLRVLIGQELDARGITDPAAIGAALGLPRAEADQLMRRHRWHEGDLARLKAAAAALGLPGSGARDAGE